MMTWVWVLAPLEAALPREEAGSPQIPLLEAIPPAITTGSSPWLHLRLSWIRLQRLQHHLGSDGGCIVRLMLHSVVIMPLVWTGVCPTVFLIVLRL